VESVLHPRKLFWVLIAAAALQAAYYFPQLPEVMASRFGADGEVLQTMSRNGFMLIHLGVIAVVAAMFGGIPLEHLPDALIHIPHKAYWLSPERRQESVAYLQDQVFSVCNATLLLLGLIFHWVLQANLRDEPHLDPAYTWVPLMTYIGYVFLWAVRLVRHYELPPPTEAD
jgi:hypothetical protein